MLKKTFTICTLATFITIAHAETCPTLSAIKTNQLNGWSVYNDGMPSVSNPLAETATEFLQADWMTEDPGDGNGHCYYNTANGVSEYYLGKTNLIADKKNPAWQTDGNDQMKCLAENHPEVCTYLSY